MGQSGVVRTSSYTIEDGTGRETWVTFEWAETGVSSTSNNTSEISWSIYRRGEIGSVVVGELSVTIDGAEIYSRSSSSHAPVKRDIPIASGKTNIKHNSDGTKSFDITIGAGIWNWGINKRGSGTGTLTPIILTTRVSPPSWASVTSSIYKGGTVTVSWGAGSAGVGNSISYYRVWYGTNSSMEYNSYVDCSASARSRNLTFENSKNTRLYFWVQTLGSAGSSYYSSGKYAGYCDVVNTPPTAPSFTLSGVILQNAKESYVTINNLSSYDADGDKITYLAHSGITSETPVSNGYRIKVDPNHNVVGIKARDSSGGESSYTYLSGNINNAPSIKSISMEPEYYTSIGGYKMVSKIKKLTASCTGHNLSYEWYFGTETSAWFFLSSPTPTDIDIRKLGNPKEFLEIKLVISDNFGEQASKTIFFNGSQDTLYYRIGVPPIPSIDSCGRNETPASADLDQKFINKQMKISFQYSTDNFDLPIQTIELYDNNNEKIKDFLVSEGLSERSFEAPSLENNGECSFKARCKDSSDTPGEFSTNTDTFVKLQTYNSQGNISVTGGSEKVWTIFPMENNKPVDYDFSVHDNLPDEFTGKLFYIVEINYDGEYQNFLQYDTAGNYTRTDGGKITLTKLKDTKKLTFEGNNFYLYKIFSRLNSEGKIDCSQQLEKVKFRFFIENDFHARGEAKEITGWTIDPTSVPYFPDDSLYIKREYRETLLKSQFQESKSNSTLFNPGEVLTLTIKQKAVDRKDISLSEKQTYIERYKLYCSFTEGGKDRQFLGFLSKTPKEQKIIQPKGGEYTTYSWSYTFPKNDNFKDKDLYFEITAIDKLNNEGASINTSKYITYCQKERPVFIMNSPKVIEKEEDNIKKEYITFSFAINSFGGKDNGKDNFLRDDSLPDDPLPHYSQAHFNFIFSNKPDFSEGESKKYTISLNLKDLNSNEDLQEIYLKNFKTSSRTYIKTTVSLQTNLWDNEYNNVEQELETYVLYKEGPVISYRPHWVGINTSEYSPNTTEIMQLSTTSQRKEVVLKGDFYQGKPVTIKIDLAKGTIDGAIVNCGTW